MSICSHGTHCIPLYCVTPKSTNKIKEFLAESARKRSSTEIRKQTLERMEQQLTESRQLFQESLYRLHDEVDHYRVPDIKLMKEFKSMPPLDDPFSSPVDAVNPFAFNPFDVDCKPSFPLHPFDPNNSFDPNTNPFGSTLNPFESTNPFDSSSNSFDSKPFEVVDVDSKPFGPVGPSSPVSTCTASSNCSISPVHDLKIEPMFVPPDIPVLSPPPIPDLQAIIPPVSCCPFGAPRDWNHSPGISPMIPPIGPSAHFLRTMYNVNSLWQRLPRKWRNGDWKFTVKCHCYFECVCFILIVRRGHRQSCSPLSPYTHSIHYFIYLLIRNVPDVFCFVITALRWMYSNWSRPFPPSMFVAAVHVSWGQRRQCTSYIFSICTVHTAQPFTLSVVGGGGNCVSLIIFLVSDCFDCILMR